ncbi:hypothetical protein ABBQ38_006188 [Trebouxia sp. C0009 RCD-2024]
MTGFKQIFPHEGLAAKVEQAVHLVTPILTEGSLLANLHVIRCMESGQSPPINQTFFNHCYSAVSHSTGKAAQQFVPAKHPSLAESYDLYTQCLPALHTKPEKPTFIKDILNAAAQRADDNFVNHVATNFIPRTMRWIRLQLGQIPYFQQLRQKQVTSWVRLLCRAATEDSNVSQLLPRFTSLANPPADVKENIEYVVATMQMLLGPLPVTDVSLRKHPTSYLSWLHLVLTDFQAAQGTPYAPKLFSMLPQTGHHTSFIKISTTALHKLVKAAGEDVPSLSKKDCKEVTSRPDYWWSRFTNCISLSRWTAPTSDRLRFHTFHDEVQTDGVSVSVLMFQPHPAQSPSAHTQQSSTRSRKRKRQQQTSEEWVRGLSDRNIGQPQRIVGLDPGRKSLFTAAIHSQSAADSLQQQHSFGANGTKYSTLSWSSGRWWEASGINYRLNKTGLWLGQNFTLKDALEATPSAKVATVALFTQHITHRMQYEAAAVDHFGDRRHRQLRRRTFIKTQQAYSALCRSISAGSQDTVVAYGDASFSSSCCKGNPSTPTVSLRRNLGYHCKVYDTDEFRTSRLCCACKTAMDGMPLPVTERGRRELGPESYSVRLCRNTECHRTLWNRDVNAAVNILRLFLDWAEGRAKPPEFCRDAH